MRIRRNRVRATVIEVLLLVAASAVTGMSGGSVAADDWNVGCMPGFLKSEDPREIIYRNFTTGPCYIHVRLRENSSGDVFNVIIENPDFALFLANLRGYDCGQIQGFLENEYPADMVALEGEIFPDASVEDIVVHLQRGHWSMDSAYSRFQTLTIDAPLALEQLGVSDESELLTGFFDYHPSKDGYFPVGEFFTPKPGVLKDYAVFPFDLSFVVLLMDLGYGVCRGDTDLLMSIHKR